MTDHAQWFMRAQMKTITPLRGWSHGSRGLHPCVLPGNVLYGHWKHLIIVRCMENRTQAEVIQTQIKLCGIINARYRARGTRRVLF